jgi:hypothetical protein
MSIIKLSDNDWNNLLPGKEFTIASTTLTIEPFGLKDLASVLRQLGPAIKSLVESGVTLDSLDDPEALTTIFAELVDKAPGVLEKACGLHRDDIARLPMATGMALVREVVEVNMEGQDSLLDNVTSLGKLISGMMGTNGE